MNMQIKAFAEYTGVSVRTLHYYDEIGLLPPAFVDRDTGYRYYNEQSALRMQEILFYRELDFPLKRIGEILSAPGYDTQKALQAQKRLLTLKKERLERLIAAIDGAMKGENQMQAFDNSEFETYKAEAEEKWGETDAYQEYAEKTRSYGKAQWNALSAGMDAIFAAFAGCMQSGAAPESAAAQTLVQRLQQHITESCYRCTNEILFGLGQMYTADPRFQANIDQHAVGTAVFVRRAIEIYCGK